MNWTNVDARWYSSNNVKAVPMYVFPVPEGTWSVEISTEGYQPTASTTDPNKGKVDGMIAYSDDQSEVWNVGINQNCNITNLKADNSWKYGHPDMEINNCHFNQGQVLEMDGTISFHVETTGSDASFFLVGPAVQKQSKYNYAVSYGAWTDRDMELGLISVSLDEKDGSRGSAMKRPRREGHSKAVSTWETINLPEKENSEKSITSQRQDSKTQPQQGFSDAGSEDNKEWDFTPGTRMFLPEDFEEPREAQNDDLLRDRGIVVDPSLLEIPDSPPPRADHKDTDPWAEVERYKSSHKALVGEDTRSRQSSLTGGSLAGGSLRKLKPVTPDEYEQAKLKDESRLQYEQDLAEYHRSLKRPSSALIPRDDGELMEMDPSQRKLMKNAGVNLDKYGRPIKKGFLSFRK
ncbi:read-through protein [Brassica yellows virus]|uniref:Read-through protein n=1 Tax=Brassica yellows virus TaxID=1046403 RepID=G3E226_9VIRU|nr:read-through protein [Brassica yellows virus]ADW41588.1 read-through protein [Brassica yellows virus]